MSRYPLNRCAHEDYNDFAEFGPEPPEIPEEMKLCGWCESYSMHCSVQIFTGAGYEEGAQCTCSSSGCANFADDEDIRDGAVFVPFFGRPCQNFAASQDALDEAAYQRANYAV